LQLVTNHPAYGRISIRQSLVAHQTEDGERTWPKSGMRWNRCAARAGTGAWRQPRGNLGHDAHRRAVATTLRPSRAGSSSNALRNEGVGGRQYDGLQLICNSLGSTKRASHEARIIWSAH